MPPGGIDPLASHHADSRPENEMRKITVSVTFSAKGNGNELLESFTLGGRIFRVREIIDGWYGPDHTYVKLSASDGCLYILRHDLTTDEWEMVLMESAEHEER